MPVTTSFPIQPDNQELARIFHRMAACYRYLGPAERYRAIAYEKVAHLLDGMKEDIRILAADRKALEELPGIGESIADKIVEYLRTGHIRIFDKLEKQVPAGLIELLDITGFGPATIRMLHDSYGIHSLDELVTAVEQNRIGEGKGLRKRKLENLLRGLKLYKASKERMLLPQALSLGNSLLAVVREIPGITKADLAGSLRRRKETIGDIDLIVCAARKQRKKIVTRLLETVQPRSLLARGETRVSFIMKSFPAQVDIRLVSEAEYGAAFLYFTGSKEHNLQLRARAKTSGWKLNEYGLFDARSGARLAGKSEKEIYRRFGLDYVPPELREDKGELELAKTHRLPELITTSDIRGDLQMHSTWSDGAEKIETIARYVLAKFPGYEYIMITDHSPSERIAHGLKPAAFRKQFEEIDRINRKLGREFIKKGVEVDILADGRLDLPDELLGRFDWVTASIHSGFSKDNTERLIRACRHPLVHCLGHPGGRLIGKRTGYPVDWDKLFAVATETGTAMEINAQPERLDLTDEQVRRALAAGVGLTISTDAHSLDQFSLMDLGVSVARRAGCEAKDILNTRTWPMLLKSINKGKRPSKKKSRQFAGTHLK